MCVPTKSLYNGIHYIDIRDVPHNYITWFAGQAAPSQLAYTILAVYAPQGKIVRLSYMCRWCYEDCRSNRSRQYGTFDMLLAKENEAERAARDSRLARSTPTNAVLPNRPLEGVLDGRTDDQFDALSYSLVRPGPPPPQQRPSGRAASERVAMSPGEGGGTITGRIGNVGALTLESIEQSLRVLERGEGRRFLDEVRNRMPPRDAPMLEITPPWPSPHVRTRDDEDIDF